MNSLINPEHALNSLAGCHVLLWSHSQCALHVECVADMLRHNRQACAADRCMDYVPIAMGSRQECDAAAQRVRSVLNERRAGYAPTFSPLE